MESQLDVNKRLAADADHMQCELHAADQDKERQALSLFLNLLCDDPRAGGTRIIACTATSLTSRRHVLLELRHGYPTLTSRRMPPSMTVCRPCAKLRLLALPCLRRRREEEQALRHALAALQAASHRQMQELDAERARSTVRSSSHDGSVWSCAHAAAHPFQQHGVPNHVCVLSCVMGMACRQWRRS